MVELIGKISKGSKMDQIYLPKNRNGFSSGSYVIIYPLNRIENKENLIEKLNLFYYNTEKIEQIKVKIIEEIIEVINNKIENDNIIITGSFIEKGFNFNDIDILIVHEDKKDISLFNKQLDELFGIKTHIIQLTKSELLEGLSTDPLYNLMLSKCASRNRLIFNVKRKINYKILDLNLLKSKTLIDNFEILNGREKYYFTMNMISILLFIKGERLSREIVNKEIEKLFDVKINEIKENILNKNFLDKYKRIYHKTFDLILNHIDNPHD